MENHKNEHLAENEGNLYLKIRELLSKSSRTFAYTLAKLPKPLSMWLGAAYLEARIEDELEDSDLAQADKRHLMKRIPGILRGGSREEILSLEKLLVGPKQDKPEGYKELLSNIGFVQEALGEFPSAVQDIIRRYCDEMADGLSNPGIQNIQTLEDHHKYCHYAAGVIGYMVSELTREAGYFNDENVRKVMPEHSDLTIGVNTAHDFGIGLQLTNDTRDLHKDAEQGIFRYPRELVEKQGLDYSKLVNLKESDKDELDKAYNHILVPQIEDAKKYIVSANQWIEELPFNPVGLRQSWGDALAMSAYTLRVINTPKFFYDKDFRKISREDVTSIDTKVLEIVQSKKSLLPFLEHLFIKDAPSYIV